MVPRAHLTGCAGWDCSFHYRDFRFPGATTLVHSLREGMEQVALGWLVREMTGSRCMVGVSAVAHMASLFFPGVLSGAMEVRADRPPSPSPIGARPMALLSLSRDLEELPVGPVITLAKAIGGRWAFRDGCAGTYARIISPRQMARST